MPENNRELRKQLKAFITQAQLNENKLQKMHQQELQFISANGLKQLIEIIMEQYKNDYQLDCVSLMLVDPDYEIRHVVNTLQLELKHKASLLFCSDATELEDILQNNSHPYLGRCDHTCHALLFPGMQQATGSIAVLPLIRNNELIGALNLASTEQQRFVAGSATDFLKRLATILAVCIENAINLEKLRLLGLTDPLTGVHNRRFFMQRLEDEINLSRRKKFPISCLFIDIDHFKSFNDVYGHAVGDDVLKHVAAILKQQMRTSDTLCRYGGEEFAILLSATEQEMAIEIAERIRRSIAQTQLSVESEEEPVHVTVSVGCATLLEINSSEEQRIGDQLLQAADQALYVSKENGRNQVTANLLQLTV